MNIELRGNDLYLVHKLAYRDENSQVLLLTDFNEACREYVETMKLQKNSILDKDYIEGFISVVMFKITLFEGEFGRIHGFKPTIERIDETVIFRQVKFFINLPKRKELEP